jgi:hydrogenase expression/formation protein HypE
VAETTDARPAGGPPVDLAAWSCPLPLRDSPTIVMGHGGGGAMSAELVDHLFLPAFGAVGAELTDSAVLDVGGARVAFSTDSYVVRPLFFPGGSIGDLAVNGTVNDLAMAGARPLYLSTAFILEEGTDLADLGRVATALGRAARAAGVRLVTGDTKVVDAGHGDGVYVNTAGIGLVREGADIRPGRARPGDAVLVSGDIGVHGVAVLSCREGLEFGTTVESDTAPLHGLVAAMLDTGADVHVLRDPTRGGLAASLNEIARAAGVGVEIVEARVPVPAPVADACSILGLDPFYVANEGKLVAVVAPEDAERVVAAMRQHPLGTGAAVVGRVREDHPGMVVARTGLGATRVVDLPVGEQLPLIC